MHNEKILFSNIFKAFLVFLLVAVGFNATVGLAYGQQNTNELKSSSDYVKIVKHYRYLNPDSALFYVKEGMAFAEANRDQLGKADLLNQYGMIEDNVTNTLKSKEKYLAAEAIYRQQKDEKGLATVLIRLASVERKSGKVSKSLKYVMEALKMSEKNGNNAGVLEARIALAQNYYSLNDIGRTIENLRLAEQIDEQRPLSNMSMDMYIYFGATYGKLKKTDSAILYLQKGLAKCNKPEYNGFKVTLLQQLGLAHIRSGEKQKGIKALKQSLDLAIEIKNLPRQHTALIEIANVYKTEKPDLALIYLERALIIATKLKKDRQRVEVLNKMSEIYKIKRNFQKALSFIEESYKLSQEVYYDDMTKQILSLEAAYELEKSKVLLSELKLKSTQEKTEKNIILSIAITVALLLLLTLIYFYRASHFNKLLRSSNDKLAESNEEKDRFFSILAHDIRSPFASAIEVLRLIAEKELDEETELEVVNKLALHCESSLDVLDKLLHWGQMQIKGTKINITQIRPLENIKSNVALLAGAAEGKNITISISIPENIIINADSDHFDFVVRNLLANAIKFTPLGGQITLIATMQTENLVCISLSDSGVGISEARIRKLFELTSTSTKGTSDEEGTSLGLLICKEFIAANNGKISVQSEVGKGTTFIFTLPGFAEELA